MKTDISCATIVETLTFLNTRMKVLARPQNICLIEVIILKIIIYLLRLYETQQN
jgi:hypothetical protein